MNKKFHQADPQGSAKQKRGVSHNHGKLAVDSMIMIYLLEQNPNYLNEIIAIFHQAEELLLSSFLYGEVLTGYYREKEFDFAEKFIAFSEVSRKTKICDFNLETAKVFASIRAKNPKLSPPDCIHLATALVYKADAFLTNDKQLKNLNGLQVIQLSEL